MKLKRLRVSNFKSFSKFEINLKEFNVLIGANASGKSNFVDLLRFLKDIVNHGLDNAISMQGGAEYLLNSQIGKDKSFSLESEFDTLIFSNTAKKGISIVYHNIFFDFEIFFKRGRLFEITKDKFTFSIDFLKYDIETKKPVKEKDKIGEGEIIFSVKDRNVLIDITTPKDIEIHNNEIFPFLSILENEKLPAQTLLFELPFFLIPPPLRDLIQNLTIYEFNPKLSQKAVPITGKMELENDGANLAIVLNNILSDRNKKRKFTNLIQDLLPFIQDTRIKKSHR